MQHFPVEFTAFLLKIASRCNLACDYCYMYQHADQSWRLQPKVMSNDILNRLAVRIAEYAQDADLGSIAIMFHGGEPLLAGPQRIADITRDLRAAVRQTTSIRFTVQTNGTLLNEEALSLLADAGVSVAISIDGGLTANDRHRRDHRGNSSFAAAQRALELLEHRPEVYAGIISVIDPFVDPEEVLGFLCPRDPPSLDLLLPDAHHERPPLGRDDDPGLYERWLVRAFDIWFDQYPHVPLRTFDSLLAACAGLPSETDAFGFGSVNMLTVETDGSYHSNDVLKITRTGATALRMHITEHSIAEAADSESIKLYNGLLQHSGLSPVCHRCPEVNVCGGGSVPHRYSNGGLMNPTVYCREMLSLISHARQRLSTTFI
ncbi:MAG TPA: cyclophane-forming radical SAM/SPASM peptide maturase YhhB [Longimicrobium sp.]